ncbi:MAG: diguanylate cyclase [Gammaproteobacteria bacterium]|nr:diguanylate cyclase [Gammaproteobacteria bacterium]NND36814.1 diguanylate cyclase [Gammaproteobacteria bacterium]
MAVTGEELANQTSALGTSVRAPREIPQSVSPLAEFRVALTLYALWAAITWLSIVAGRTVLPPQAAGVLTVGVIATNALFLLIARTDQTQRPPAVTITLSQSVLGITWATLFAFMSAGSNELVLALYISAMLFAVPRISIAAAAQLTAFATASFGIVVMFKALLTGSDPPLWPEFISVMVFAGVMASVLLYRRLLGAAVKDGADDYVVAGATTDTLSRYRSMLDALTREKGRTDRSNTPFSLCLFDTDGFDRVLVDHGRETADRVRDRIATRIRGELRAMDGVKPVTNERAFDRLGNGQFMVILPTANHAGATRCAERICAAIRRYPIEGQYAVTLYGAAVEYRRGETVRMLLDRAEAALERARAAGGDQVVGYDAGEERCADVIQIPDRTS